MCQLNLHIIPDISGDEVHQHLGHHSDLDSPARVHCCHEHDDHEESADIWAALSTGENESGHLLLPSGTQPFTSCK